MGAPISIARTLVIALLVLLTACAVGSDPESIQLLSVAGPDSEESTGTTTDSDSFGDEHGEKTGATPLDSSEGAGIDIDDATTSGAGSLESSTDGSSDGEGSTTTAEPEPEPESEPEGTPMYEPCADGSECEDGVCIRLVADGGIELGSYCSAPCENPVADCDAPAGSAEPLCLVIDTSVVCGLECTGGLSCPAGMSCFGFTSGDYCF
jgi:hypothetical protein